MPLTSPSSDPVLVAIRQIIRATDLYSRRLSKQAGLTAPQLLVLQALSATADSGLSMAGLARSLSLSAATITVILDRLVARELVRRERDPRDRRRMQARLTPAGQALLAQAPRPLQEDFSRRYQALPAERRQQILDALQQVAAMMNAEALDASPVLHLGPITPPSASPDPRTDWPTPDIGAVPPEPGGPLDA